jgi:hypothetical protein
VSDADEYDVGRWIVERIRADVPGVNGIHLDLIPRETPLPAVRYTFQSRGDTSVVDGNIVVTRFRALVLAVVEGHQLNAVRPLAQAVHAALHKQADGDVAGLTIIRHCRRVQPFTTTTYEGGQTFRHGGGIYDIVAQGTP